MERMELLVHAATDLVNPLEVIRARWSPKWLEEHNRKGGGSVRIRVDDEILMDARNLLQKGRMIRVLVEGQDRGFWELERDARIIVDGMEKNNEYIEFSGSGIREWLTHAIVLPEQGIGQIGGDDRAFNYASAEGDWFKASEWKPVVSQGKVLTNENIWFQQMPGSPKGWPAKVEAWWLWDRQPGAISSHPSGYVYFRRKFTTTKAEGRYRILMTADDKAIVMINGVRTMRSSYWPNTWESDIQLPPGDHILSIAVWNQNPIPTANPGGLVLAICNLEGDGSKATEELTNDDRLLWTEATSGSWIVNAYPIRPPGFTIGGIILQLLKEARARDSQSRLHLIRTDFTNDLDSYGQPWPMTIDPTFRIGDTLAEVVQQICDSYGDVWFEGNLMRTARQRGVDRSVPIGAKEAVMFQKGKNVLDAGTDSTAEIANVVYAKTASTFQRNVGPADSISQFGPRETFLSAVNASDNGTAPYLIQQVFDKFARERRSPTLQIRSGEGYQPFRDFNVGDWVLAPSDDGRDLIKRRIVSIAVGEDVNGRPEYSCEIDTIQETLEERYTRWLTELADGNKQGGISGTSRGISEGDISFGGAQDGAPVPPVQIVYQSPTPPTGLTVLADTYIADGRPAGKLLASWGHNGLNVEGGSQTPRLYEVYGRLQGTGQFKSFGQTPAKSIEISPLAAVNTVGVALKYEVFVRAISPEGLESGPSTIFAVTMTKDTIAPLAPAAPTAAAVRGVFTLYYSGLDLNGAPMAPDTYRVVGQSRTGAGLWVTKGQLGFGGLGSLAIGDLPYGTHAFRLIAYDFAGNESVPSAVVTSTSQPLVGDAEFTTAFDKLNTDIGANVVATTAAAALAKDAQLAAEAAARTAGSAGSAASTAQQAANDAAAAALSAAGLAGSKGEVIYQATAPTGTRAVAQNLWIKIPGNTPYRWNPDSQLVNKWEAVTDQAVVDAAKAAGDALAAANKAQADATAAGEAAAKALADAKLGAEQAEAARLAAVRAQSTADGKTTVSPLAPTAADLTGKPAGALWTQVVSGKVVGSWYRASATAPGWSPMPFDTVMIPQISLGVGTFGELDGVRLKASTIGVRELLVGDYENYAAGGNFDYAADVPVNWDGYNTTRMSITTTAPQSGIGCLQVNPGAAMSLTLRSSFPVVEGERFLIEYWEKTTTGWNGTVESRLRLVDQNAVLRSSTAMIASTVWLKREVELVIPARVTTLTPILTFDAAVGTTYIDGLKIRRMEMGSLLVDGAVKARKIDVNEFFADNGVVGKLTAQMAVFLTNEDGTGYTSTVTGQGLRVTYTTKDAAGNVVEVQEVIKLGTFDEDYLTISKGGIPVINLDADGSITGENVYANKSLIYRGEELERVLARLPRGPLYKAELAKSVDYIGQEDSKYGLVEASYKIDGDRQINVECGIQTYPNGVDSEMYAGLAITYDGSAPTINGPFLVSWQLGKVSGDTYDTKTFVHQIRLNGNRARDGQTVRILLCVWRGIGNDLRVIGGYRTYMYLTDIGLGLEHTPNHNPGGGRLWPPAVNTPAPQPPVAAKVNQTRQWDTNGVRSYVGSGGTYAYNTSRGYQGLSPAGYGNLKSIWTFPNMSAELAGAEIHWIEAYFYFEHWWYNNGGTARIHAHGHTGLPGSYSDSGLMAVSGGWPKGAGRWVRLPASVHGGFQSGAYRGLALNGDGGYETYGIAQTSSIRVNYSK